MVAAVGQIFLGLTVNCARCHDHKFDPIRQRDYYRIKAALEGVLHGDRPLPYVGETGAETGHDGVCRKSAAAAADVRAGARRCREAGRAGRRGRAVGGAVAVAGVRPGRRCARVEPAACPRRMDRRSGQSLDGQGHGQSRLALPLRHGLGRDAQRLRPQRRPPLASRSCSTGWRRTSSRTAPALKALHRRIMLSDTYRRSSRFDAKAAAVDAGDRLLWRYPARRLEAEAIRDAMLLAAASSTRGWAARASGRSRSRCSTRTSMSWPTSPGPTTTAARSIGSTSIRPRTRSWRRSTARIRRSRPRAGP